MWQQRRKGTFQAIMILPSLFLATHLFSDDSDDFLALQAVFFKQFNAGQYMKAEQSARRLLDLANQKFDSPEVLANCLNNLGNVYREMARYADARALHERALALRKTALGDGHPSVAQSLLNLSNIFSAEARYQDSEACLRQALAIYQRQPDIWHQELGMVYNNLGIACKHLGRLQEAEDVLLQSLAVRRRWIGPRSADVAQTLLNLSPIYFDEARYAESESVLKQAISIYEGQFGASHPELAKALFMLARIYQNHSRYALAEPLLKRSLAMQEHLMGRDHPDVAQILNNLGVLYFYEGRFEEARAVDERALAIRRRRLPPDHPEIAESLNNLAGEYRSFGRTEDAERCMKEALSIRERAFGAQHPLVADTLANLANGCVDVGRNEDAEALYLRALLIHESAAVADTAKLAYTLGALARLCRLRNRLAEALAYAERAVELSQRSSTSQHGGFAYHEEQAQILWLLGRKTNAVVALARALERAEEQRSGSSGGETDRARTFGLFSDAFAQMADWQVRLGNVAQAFTAAERGRTRSLLDQLEVQGVDLLAGAPAAEASALRRRQTAAQIEISSLQQQRRALDAGSDSDRARRREWLDARLKEAQEKLIDVYRDVRNVSPAYRLSAGKSLTPIQLSEVREWVDANRALWLQYSIGNNFANVCVLRAGSEPRFAELELNDAEAAAVSMKPGPLTINRLEQLLKVEGQGLPQLLSSRAGADLALPRLAQLWKVLIPEEERRALMSGEIERLVVVPDGPLALVPFETLVVELGQKPKFLLDVGPPVLYAPSATVLFQLAAPRVTGENSDNKQPVLTVANPMYASAPPAADTIANQMTSRAQYRSAGGALAELPYTGSESAWVAEGFKKRGLTVAALRRDLATENNVRGNVQGRKVLHFACHGLADQAYGNFFGCLALTPGPRAATNPADDGFLTLPEIYELNLKQCDLAILSACQTNYGPQQKGEGVWALSRGFLVAGARRVVASNWLVDDEAAATLVSAFCSDLAKAEGGGETPDYAAALHRAKRCVRKQDKWSSPYYWGTFVLVGPN